MVIYLKILILIQYILQLVQDGGNDSELSTTEIRIASSKTNAELADPCFY